MLAVFKMRPEQTLNTAHPCIYPGVRRPFVDSFLDRGAHWMRIDHIPWHQNPLVLYEQEMIKSGKISYGKRRAHEWRYKGKIYHRDVFNHVWQKEDGKMKWIGTYDPQNDVFDFSASEPK
jgi:hypothetical protein